MRNYSNYAKNKKIKESLKVKKRLFEEETTSNLKKFHLVYSVDGTKSEQTVSAQNMQQAEELVKKQYSDKNISFTSRQEVKESLDTNTYPENNTIATELIAAINDEWEAIQKYNDLIINLQAQGYEEFIDVIEDILEEENIHVGQLEELLQNISSNTEKVAEGHQEAKEELCDDYDDCDDDDYDDIYDDDFGSNSGFEFYF